MGSKGSPRRVILLLSVRVQSTYFSVGKRTYLLGLLMVKAFNLIMMGVVFEVSPVFLRESVMRPCVQSC